MRAEAALQLGVDGGGSGSRFVLYAPASGQHYSFTGPALQARQLTPAELAGRITERLAPVLPPAQWSQICSISTGLAGGSSGRDAITLHLREAFPQAKVLVMSDAEACFWAHFPTAEQGTGAALLMCGTGSVLVYERGQALHYLGGYGPAAFEACGGRQIGRDFLSKLAELYDAKQIPKVFERYGCAPTRRSELLQLLYETPNSPACFAPVCVELAAAGNPICHEIVTAHLAAATRLAESLPHKSGEIVRIGLYGGIMKASYLRKQLADRLQKYFNVFYIFYAQADVARFLSERSAASSTFFRQA